jgi:Tfp pilus assembly protein PilO
MPFDVEADGPYYSVLDFFSRLGRLSRIINVGDLKLTSIATNNNGGKFRMIPGSSVAGSFTITTFFTNPTEQPAAPAGAPVKR